MSQHLHRTVTVDLGDRSYDIHIGPGVLADLGVRTASATDGRSAVLVSDRTVDGHYGDTARRSLSDAGFRVTTILVDPGEASKSFASLEAVLGQMLDIPVTRSSPVIALGGGVVGDLAGFAAAVTLRGLPYIQVPTSLLAQVDSAVGGKTGINATQGKNLVGAFHQPKAVLADTDTLASLPPRELRAGYAEIVKYGALGDAAFFDWLVENGGLVLQGDKAALAEAIAVSCRAKADIVAEDEKEAGRRALLNLGHTFGHAFEAECAYDGRLLHGEAVAIGMVMAANLSARLGLCPQGDADRLRTHLSQAGLPISTDAIADFENDPDRLIAHMRHDKKAMDDTLVFILLRRLGQAFISREVKVDAVRAVLTA
ncbi:MAG: 3-dehydroquinate synthase [Pseudomonadota bacterium]